MPCMHTFLTSNFFFPSAASPLAPALALFTLGAAPASVISTSAMVVVVVVWCVGWMRWCCVVRLGGVVCVDDKRLMNRRGCRVVALKKCRREQATLD